MSVAYTRRRLYTAVALTILLIGCTGTPDSPGIHNEIAVQTAAESFAAHFLTGNGAQMLPHIADTVIWTQHDAATNNPISQRHMTKDDMLDAARNRLQQTVTANVHVRYAHGVNIDGNTAHAAGTVTLTVDNEQHVIPLAMDLAKTDGKWRIVTLHWWTDVLADDTPTDPVDKHPGLISTYFLPIYITDAMYNTGLDKIIGVTQSPPALHIINPLAETIVTVPLNHPPVAFDISPQGHIAAVGHNKYVSYVNLTSATVEKVLPMQHNIVDIAVADTGYVYVFPQADQWTSLYSINVNTGESFPHEGTPLRGGTVGTVHPSGDYIYTVTSLGSRYLMKYDISQPAARHMYSAPQQNSAPAGPGLWMSPDGTKIFTASGRVFRSSPVYDVDMVMEGTFDIAIQHANHGVAAQRVAAITTQATTHIYNDTDFSLVRTVDTAALPVAGNRYNGSPRYAFFSNDGQHLFVLFHATAGSTGRIGVAVFGPKAWEEK